MPGEIPPPAEVLSFIAREEPLERTLDRWPELTRRDLARLLEAVAAAAGSRERAATGKRPTAPSTPPATEAHAARYPTPTGRPVPTGLRRVRVYSDGAARGNPGPAGAGAVLMAPDGTVVERLGKYLGTNTNNYAEYMGLILGLRRALELGVREVEVRADSELLVRQLQGRYKVKAPNLKPLFEEALALLHEFERVDLAHVRREQNEHADEMSNRAIDELM